MMLSNVMFAVGIFLGLSMLCGVVYLLAVYG